MTMEVLRPRSLLEALAMKARRTEAVPIAGGTDLMVDINLHHLRPPAILDLGRLPELDIIRLENGHAYVGAGVTYSRLVRELDDPGPLLQAARSIGSPEIRHRATLGGNLGTASPAGDMLPVLAAYDADVEVASASRGRRRLPWNEFLVGPKRTALERDELIVGATWRIPRGAGSFSKVGPRNALVIAVVGLCLVLDSTRRRLKVGLGSVGPTVLRATAGEAFIEPVLERAGAWTGDRARLTPSDFEEFGNLVASAARPIDDVRGMARYRTHACAVLARRALAWALEG